MRLLIIVDVTKCDCNFKCQIGQELKSPKRPKKWILLSGFWNIDHWDLGNQNTLEAYASASKNLWLRFSLIIFCLGNHLRSYWCQEYHNGLKYCCCFTLVKFPSKYSTTIRITLILQSARKLSKECFIILYHKKFLHISHNTLGQLMMIFCLSIKPPNTIEQQMMIFCLNRKSLSVWNPGAPWMEIREIWNRR